MSSNNSNQRTIDGASIIEADTINIFEKLEINGNTGNPKQIIRLKADGSENIEYSNLEALTFTGASTDVYNGIDARTINIPSALTSAGDPLVINSGVISFNGNLTGNLDLNNNSLLNVNSIGIKSTGTGITMSDKPITNLGGISMTTNTSEIDMNNGNISECNNINTATLTASGNINANGNIIGDGSTDITGIDEIVSDFIVSNNTITATGNILANGNIQGDNATTISHINTITCSGNITSTTGNLTLGGTGSIVADMEITGNLNANGNIIGDNSTNLLLINDVSSVSITTSGNINANGNIVGDTATDITGINDLSVGGQITASGNIVGNSSNKIEAIDEVNTKTNKCKIFKIFSDDNLTNQIFSFDGVSNNLQGSGATDLSGINNIVATTFNIGSTLIFDGNQLLVGTGPHIHKTNGIDMNETGITDAKSIIYKDTASNVFQGTASNKVVFSNCDFSSITNTQATPDPTPTLTSLTVNGNTHLAQTSGDVFIGSFSQTTHTRPVATFMSSIYRRFNIQSDLVGTSGISGKLEYMVRNRIQERSYRSPYDDNEYFTPNIGGTTYLYDHITKLSGDSNHKPYRVIKIHPTNWTGNEDSTFNDIAIEDPGTYATSGNITYGGLRARHSTIIEAWCYLDIPEGFKFKAIFMRVASSTAGTSYIARNVKVFKRHIGEFFNDGNFSVKILDGNTATSGNTPIYAGTGVSDISEQDLVNEYDNSMAIRIETGNLNYIIGGGYIICEPINPATIYYSVAITSGNTHYSNFTATIKDDFTPNTVLATHTFTNKNQTRTFIVGYTYGISRRFFITFQTAVDGDDYTYDLLCNKCVVDSVSSISIDSNIPEYLELFRQNPTISFQQQPP